jgi:hypothetical protein
VLDPLISYEVLKADYADDPTLAGYLEHLKSKLSTYFNENYANSDVLMLSTPPPTSAPTPLTQSPQKSFTDRYSRKKKDVT